MAVDRAQIIITAVDQTRSAFASVKSNLEGLSSAANKINRVLASLGAALSAGALAAFVKSAVNAADELNKLSQRTGIAVETLSLLKPAAQLSGVALQEFTNGLERLSVSMLNAARGSKEQADAFAALGVSVTDASGQLRSTEEVLLDIADAFAAMPDGSAKAALAIKIFGRSGAELIPFLNQGRAGIRALTDEMQALGAQIGGDTAAQAEAFNDALLKLRVAVNSIGPRIIEAFLPVMTALANSLVESAKQGGALRLALDGVVLVLKALTLGAAAAGKAVVTFGEIIGGAVAAAVLALRGNLNAAKAVIADIKNNLLQGLDDLAKLWDNLFNPKPIETKTPQIQVVGAPALQQFSVNLSTVKAQLDAELEVLKDGLARQKAALDAALEDRLVSIREYYAQKTIVEQREIDAEIERIQSLLAEQRRIAREGSESERQRALADIAKLEAELITLNNKRADIEQANARAAAAAERELADALAAAREELARLTGTETVEDRRAAIERSYRDLRARLLAEGDVEGVSLVDRLIDVKTAQANLEALEAAWREALERMRIVQEEARIAFEAGLITQREYQARVTQASQEAAAALDDLIPKMEQAAAAIGPDASLRVATFRNELERTRLVADEYAPLWDSIGRSFGDALQGMITSTQSFYEALTNLFRQISDAFLRHLVIEPFQEWVAMQTRMLALKLGFLRQEQAMEKSAAAQSIATKSAETVTRVSMEAAQAGAGAASSQASIPYVGPVLAIAAMTAVFAAVMALLSRIKKYATGGYVEGPGTSTSDSILARLSAGEYVIRADVVKRLGVAFFDAINGLRLPPRTVEGRLAFAMGGLVPEVRTVPAASSGLQSLRIINAIDPNVIFNHLQTPSGERTIINIIGRNARAINAMLQA